MKRILQAVAVVALAGAAPQAASAFDADLTLDRFPTSGERAVSSVREWRGGDEIRRSGSIRDGLGSQRVAHYDGSGYGHYHRSGSLVDVRTYGGAVERGSFYGTAGTAQSSFIVIGLPEAAGSIVPAGQGALRGGAKILDVEDDRLDRRPYGKNGLAIAHVGTAKIIRISPNFRRGQSRDETAAAADEEPTVTEPVATPFAELSPREQAVTVYPDPEITERPVDPPAPRVAERAIVPPVPTPAPPATAPADGLEPWTPDWLRDCVARYPDFDASLGTYTAADGRRRFCTGEP